MVTGNRCIGSGSGAPQRFSYRQNDVDRILQVALRLAGTRRQRLCVVLKRGGAPSIAPTMG